MSKIPELAGRVGRTKPQGSTYLVDDKLYSSDLPYICHVCAQPYRRADALTHRQQFGHWPHEFGATESEVVFEEVRRILGW